MSQSNTALGLDQAFEQLAQHVDQAMGVLAATQADNQQLREQLAEQSASLHATQTQALALQTQAKDLLAQLTDCHTRLASMLAEPEEQTLDALLQQLETRLEPSYPNQAATPEAVAPAPESVPVESVPVESVPVESVPADASPVAPIASDGETLLNETLALAHETSSSQAHQANYDIDHSVEGQADTSSDIDDSESKPHPKAVLRSWCQRYPNTFMLEQPQPLQIGLHEALAEIDQIDIKLVRRALAHYVKTPRYLRCLRTGAVRLDLEGHNAGFVTAEEAQHAQDELKLLDQKRKDRERERQERQLQDKLTQLVNRY